MQNPPPLINHFRHYYKEICRWQVSQYLALKLPTDFLHYFQKKNVVVLSHDATCFHKPLQANDVTYGVSNLKSSSILQWLVWFPHRVSYLCSIYSRPVESCPAPALSTPCLPEPSGPHITSHWCINVIKNILRAELSVLLSYCSGSSEQGRVL